MNIIEYDTKIIKISNEIDDLVVEFKSIEDKKVYENEETFCSFNNLVPCVKKQCGSSVSVVKDFVIPQHCMLSKIQDLLKLERNSHTDYFVCLKSIHLYCSRNNYKERVWYSDIKQYNTSLCSVINESYEKKKELFDELVELCEQVEKIEREKAREKLKAKKQDKKGFVYKTIEKVLDKVFNV